jgi:hypothetical protein
MEFCASSDDDSSDDDSSDDGAGGIGLADGLSAATLAALLQFVVKPNDDASSEEKPCDEQVEDIYAMSQMIEGCLDQRKPDPSRVCRDIEATLDIQEAVEVLKRTGVVRLNNVLRADLCDQCTLSIDETLLTAVSVGADHFTAGVETGFGNVDSKELRWDMFLRNEGAYEASYHSMFSRADNGESSLLGGFFDALFAGEDAAFYEYAALISDNGAFTQRIHSDTTYQEDCPLYTVFIALQDISADMGPTVFIPASNTVDMHKEFRLRRHQWLSDSEYSHALLRKGDCVIMDSRTFHCASANSGGRRRLLYFTLLNPKTRDMGGGSLFSDMKLSLHQFSRPVVL